jgi:general secretion pathway protein A
VASHDDLARAPNAATRAGMIATLRAFLASLSSIDAMAVVIIDAAQRLPVEVLADLPVLAQRDESSRALQVILVGDPTLATIVKRAELRLLKEEVAVWPHLRPLAADDIGRYITHRLGVAGSRPGVSFDDGACVRLYEISGGVPRVVNQLCERAMTIGASQSVTAIGAALIDTAAGQLGLYPRAAAPSQALRAAVVVAALIALMALGAGSALWVFRAGVAAAFVRWQNIPAAPRAPELPRPDPPQPIALPDPPPPAAGP